MNSSLAKALSGGGQGLDFRVGTVTTTSPLTVELPVGSLSATARLSSYTPGLGDVVVVLVNGSGAAIVLGELL